MDSPTGKLLGGADLKNPKNSAAFAVPFTAAGDDKFHKVYLVARRNAGETGVLRIESLKFKPS
jgi:hypothetical protein